MPPDEHNLLVALQIGEPDNNHFSVNDNPELLVTVKNDNVPPCLITVEVCCDGKDVRVDGKQQWSSEEKKAAGRGLENSERTFNVKLELIRQCKDRSLKLIVKWRRPADAEREPPTPPDRIKEYERSIWVT